MKYVFVESNWVYTYCGPAYRRTQEAEELVKRAAAGELRIEVPSVAIREGGNAIRLKWPKVDKELGEFRRWAVRERRIDRALADAAVEFLEAHQAQLQSEMATLDDRLDELLHLPGVNVFALDQRMLDRAISLRQQAADLKPFDEAILAAILIRAADVRSDAKSGVFFCSLDKSDLGAMDRKGQPRRQLASLYAEAGIINRSDFLVP
jgi:hypothetical protein